MAGKQKAKKPEKPNFDHGISDSDAVSPAVIHDSLYTNKNFDFFNAQEQIPSSAQLAGKKNKKESQAAGKNKQESPAAGKNSEVVTCDCLVSACFVSACTSAVPMSCEAKFSS